MGACSRLVYPNQGCRRTFRDQLPGVLNRYQRRNMVIGLPLSSAVRRCPPWMGTPASRVTPSIEYRAGPDEDGWPDPRGFMDANADRRRQSRVSQCLRHCTVIAAGGPLAMPAMRTPHGCSLLG